MRAWPAALLLSACSAGVVPPAPPSASDSAAWYRAAAAAGTPVFAVVPDQSLIAVTVRRGGLLARLGHDHVVASHAVGGFASPAAGRADLAFRLDQLAVDEPALRAVASLDTHPSPAAIEGTRANMLGRVLQAERYPVVRLHAEGRAGTLQVAVTLHGVTRRIAVPVALEYGPRQLRASGQLLLRQSDFGITPLSLAGGLLSVQDALEVRFRIVARR
jgi:hypothetical protein